MRFILLFLTVFSFSLVLAQDSILVTKNFKFEDGIYLNFTAFQENNPDHEWKEVTSEVFINGESFISKTEAFVLKKGKEIPFSEIWGFSYNGIPYIRVRNEGEFATFSALRVRGKLCYFTYEEKVSEWVEISAYNPVNGRPFRTGKVERVHDVQREKMLFFESGEIKDFNPANFLAVVEEFDKPLWNALSELTEEEAQKKLFKSLLIFDDRHEVFIKKSGTTSNQ
ncbi:MAG: hypothetical protein DWQ02_08890 [Bacteroidetes bacterium]|nr:MAG: hypothetical protein DWQ02_08890 [Bacteroidota bacterium]